MSAYKQFLSSDIIVTPFEVNKSFYFNGESELNATNVKIDRFVGAKEGELNFNSESWSKTGNVKEEYKDLVFNSIKKLYYGNYTTDGNEGTSTAASGSYNNSLPTDLYFERFFPPENSYFFNDIGVLSIPSKLYGNRIQPKSFIFTSSSITITDDGEGNLKIGNKFVGNIFYNQGIAVIIGAGGGTNGGGAKYGSAVYNTDVYGPTEDIHIASNFMTYADVTLSFSSSYDIFETQYKCTIDASEFNYSSNPSLLSDSLRGDDKILQSGSSQYSDFVTSSYFSPFVTTVGLYNDNRELVAVGKLSQPLPTSQTTDTTIFINIDR